MLRITTHKKVFIGMVICGLIVFLAFVSQKKGMPQDTRMLASSVLSDLVSQEVVVGTDILSVAEASFAGSSVGRENNVTLGMSRINNTILLPGEEFSFQKTIGEVKAEDGFSEEKIFLNGEVTKGLGGGLCQVSTALFRSVIGAGLPVTERHNHSYSVSYYDAGLDATYADPGPDFKFVNDTKHPIKILGKVEDKKAIIEIVGTYDGRIASTSEAEIYNIVDILPTKYLYTEALAEGQRECMNASQIGYTAKVIYDVLFPDGKKHEQTFTSVYKPLQKVCFIVGIEGLKKFTAGR